MRNLNKDLVLETINMIKLYNLDIRTVTMSVSLRDCISSDVNVVTKKIRDKILKYSDKFIQYAQETSNDYAIPIVNKRIAVTPVSILGEACEKYDYLK